LDLNRLETLFSKSIDLNLDLEMKGKVLDFGLENKYCLSLFSRPMKLRLHKLCGKSSRFLIIKLMFNNNERVPF